MFTKVVYNLSKQSEIKNVIIRIFVIKLRSSMKWFWGPSDGFITLWCIKLQCFFPQVSIQTLISSPFPPIYEPLSPELRSTRWRGTSGEPKRTTDKRLHERIKKYLKINQFVMIVATNSLSYSSWLNPLLAQLLDCWSFQNLKMKILKMSHFLKQCPRHLCFKRVWKKNKGGKQWQLKSLFLVCVCV